MQVIVTSLHPAPQPVTDIHHKRATVISPHLVINFMTLNWRPEATYHRDIEYDLSASKVKSHFISKFQSDS